MPPFAHTDLTPRVGSLVETDLPTLLSGEHASGCANFVACGKANSISKAGKKADSFMSKWVMMDAKCIHPQSKARSDLALRRSQRVRAKRHGPQLATDRVNAWRLMGRGRLRFRILLW